MATTASVNGQDLLARWLESERPSAAASAGTPSAQPGLRFAFYGRTSTTRHQDRATSQGWQREAAELLMASHGTIVARSSTPAAHDAAPGPPDRKPHGSWNSPLAEASTP